MGEQEVSTMSKLLAMRSEIEVPENILQFKPDEADHIFLTVGVRQGLARSKYYGMKLILGGHEILEDFARKRVIAKKLYATSRTPDGVRLCRDLGFTERSVPGSDVRRFELDLETSTSPFVKGYKEDINMSNPYIARVEAMVSSSNISITWSTLEEAKMYVANIQQLQKEIKIFKSEVTLAKQQVHSNYTDKKVHVGKGFGAGVATGLFGAREVGRANSLTRNRIRHEELKAIEPYVEAERFISKVLAGLDKLKLELKAWIATQRTK